MNIPKLKKIKTTKNYHGIPLEDDYSWVDQPNILEVLKAANQLQKKIHPDMNRNVDSSRLSQLVNEAKEKIIKTDFS